MKSELLSYYQSRVTTAYQEQVWAVALVCAMNAFIASHATLLLKGFPLWLLQGGISIFSLLAMAFVFIRHRIFAHYDRCIKEELRTILPNSPLSASYIPQYQALLAGWSGVSFYVLIIVALWSIAFRTLETHP